MGANQLWGKSLSTVNTVINKAIKKLPMKHNGVYQSGMIIFCNKNELMYPVIRVRKGLGLEFFFSSLIYLQSYSSVDYRLIQ